MCLSDMITNSIKEVKAQQRAEAGAQGTNNNKPAIDTDDEACLPIQYS